MALLGSIAAFAHVIGGLTNKSLRAQMAAHWRADTPRPRPPMTSGACA